MNLHPHQQKFLDKNPDKALLVWSAGTGKTFVAKYWIEKGREKNALIVCPKQIIGKWKDMCPYATIVSKDEFKKLNILKEFSCLVCDEADAFNSPLFTRQRSQRSTAMYNFIKAYPTMPVLLMTATPVSSNPDNLHTILCYLGIIYSPSKWKEKFFRLEYRPYLPRPAYFPVSNWRKLIRPILEKHSDIVLMRDCVEFLPPIRHEIISVEVPEYTPQEWEPMKIFVEEHRNEQKLKPKEVIELGKKHRKLFVVAHYTEQIKELEKMLSKHKQVYVLDGSTKNPTNVIQEAEDDPECYFIVQGSVGAGFDCPSFEAMVFASMSYKARDYVQMKARIYRINHLHPVIYYYLIAGKKDRAIYDRVMLGRDFIPSEMYETATTTKEV